GVCIVSVIEGGWRRAREDPVSGIYNRLILQHGVHAAAIGGATRPATARIMALSVVKSRRFVPRRAAPSSPPCRRRSPSPCSVCDRTPVWRSGQRPHANPANRRCLTAVAATPER